MTKVIPFRRLLSITLVKDRDEYASTILDNLIALGGAIRNVLSHCRAETITSSCKREDVQSADPICDP